LESGVADNTVQKSFDLGLAIQNALLVLSIEFSVVLKRRDEVRGVVGEECFSEPVAVLILSEDGFLSEVGAQGEFEFVA